MFIYKYSLFSYIFINFKIRLTKLFFNYTILVEVIMNLKKFEYLNKDIPFLKKDILFRLTFAILYFAVFCWQFASVVIKILNNEEINIGMIIATISVLLVSLLFAGISIMYALKSHKVLSVIKKKGRCVSSVEILFNTNKTSFMKLYSFITEALTIICTIVLLCSLLYTILQIGYLSTMSFYLPLLVVICICGYYSSYHINAEISIVNNVNSYNSIY